jgi:hypothetical protein
MTSEKEVYFARRAEQELSRARTASDENAARAHYIMAGHYLDICRNGHDSWRRAIRGDDAAE